MKLNPFRPIRLTPTTVLKLKMATSQVSCGFPSPADDYLEKSIDLNEYLIKKPSATFLVRAKGDSMLGAGIFDNSILIVDRSLESRNGRICVVRINDEFTVKRFFHYGTHIVLKAENTKFKDKLIQLDEDFEVWGVVRSIITEVL